MSESRIPDASRCRIEGASRALDRVARRPRFKQPASLGTDEPQAIIGGAIAAPHQAP